jgi:ribulose-phosphate 3-epimerase
MKLIAPSILSADFSNLEKQILLAEEGGADWIHCDVMDGHFVPNITFGPILVRAAKKCSKLPLDVHLMISEPDKYAADFAKNGADYITIHQEAVIHLHRSIDFIKKLGVKVGVAVNPSTPFSFLYEVIDMIDLLLIMSVNPGFGGQSFIKNSLKKIEQAAELKNKNSLNYLIEVDGGINKDTIKSVSDAGCEVFVAGSSVFHSDDIPSAVKTLKLMI